MILIIGGRGEEGSLIKECPFFYPTTAATLGLREMERLYVVVKKGDGRLRCPFCRAPARAAIERLNKRV
jgi:hypothetical protein